ncbi:aldehyde dehydrogenase family protein [Paraburkholderia bannensis]|uniref:aldehyde dehydrogenase family protein n=1 Tax=Paraburkholderia bannensis TaxID=765414 RepID=UPI002AC36E53|nr:aldehyde dehydrogenase family protein [Paraburkholderia bannensis]
MGIDRNEWGVAKGCVREYGHFIDGTEVPSSGERIERHSPATGELVASWPTGTIADVDRAVKTAVEAFEDGRWSGLTASQRSEVLSRVAVQLKNDWKRLALIETLETGKAIAQSADEIPWSGDMWDFAAGQARALHGDAYSSFGDSKLALALREPVGPVGIITPWNYPMVVLAQKLPYALAAGCTVVVKPSEFTSGTTLELARILREAGLPDGVFNVVTGYGNPVGQRLAEHPDIRLVSFTGSTATGRKIVEASAFNMKKVVLELGGKNPNIIFADANLDAAVDGAIKAFVYNSGAECCSGSRVIVQKNIADKFISRLCEKLDSIAIGDPLDLATKMGSINNQPQYEKILKFIEAGKNEATLVRGGRALPDRGCFYIEPTVFKNVPLDASIAKEEIFGPVIAVMPFETIDEAIRIANDTEYGLASSVWTSDLATATRMARKVNAGVVWVNTFLDLPSEIPVGGVRQSGYGRENGRYAAEEYTVIKTVVLQDPTAAARYLD